MCSRVGRLKRACDGVAGEWTAGELCIGDDTVEGTLESADVIVRLVGDELEGCVGWGLGQVGGQRSKDLQTLGGRWRAKLDGETGVETRAEVWREPLERMGRCICSEYDVTLG